VSVGHWVGIKQGQLEFCLIHYPKIFGTVSVTGKINEIVLVVIRNDENYSLFIGDNIFGKDK